jgi:peptidyl-prolyl cis-trans isomerase C
MTNFKAGHHSRPIMARFAATALAAMMTCSVVFAADGDILARVNGKDITKDQVSVAMEVFAQQLQSVPEVERQAMVVDALVDMYLMADAASAAGLETSQKFIDRLAFLKAQALRNTYIEESIQKGITEEAMKARFEKDLAGYTPPEEVHARHILVKTEDEAKDIIKRLGAGEDFIALAKEKSEDPGSKESGGDLGYFTKGQMVPEFETEAFSLKPGETSTKPVKSDFGFHVLKVEDKRLQPLPKFEEVKPQVQEAMQREAFQSELAKLKSAAKIERFDQAKTPAEEKAPADGEAPVETPTPAPAP